MKLLTLFSCVAAATAAVTPRHDAEPAENNLQSRAASCNVCVNTVKSSITTIWGPYAIPYDHGGQTSRGVYTGCDVHIDRKRTTDCRSSSLATSHSSYIGPEKEQFTAHESSIASLSEPLRVLVTGGMKEAIEAKVIWEDVEPAVFVSLVEFAYTGNFSTPKSEDQGDHDGLEAPDVDEGSRANERKDKRDVKDDRDEEDDKDEKDKADPGNLDTNQYATLMSCMEGDSDSIWKACANGRFSHKHFRLKQFHQLKDNPSGLNVDIIPYDVKAYIMTAKLYVLADKYDIAELRSLCLLRFTYNLAHISGMGKTMEILAATIRYVYAHTMSKDQLRKLLLRFLITDMQWALSDNGMRKMLSDIPELASQMILLVPSYYWDELQHGRPPKSTQADMTS
ncbi:hypothetical protein CGCVW01_v003699 [Colletotrichum viniferum]|nr:hypothetical protein CGCVW01_v003699 [Colletotrichum viniferum]